MFGFSKRAQKRNKGSEDIVEAKDLLDSEYEQGQDEYEYETKLFIPKGMKLSSEDRYVYAFHNNESPKLKLNQLSLYSIEINELQNKNLIVHGLIRSTVQQPIKFKKTTILLIGADNEVLARKEFDLAKIGDIPKNSAVPHEFIFTKDDLLKEIDLPLEEWSLAFSLPKKHQLELEESWDQSIAEETKTQLQKIVDNAPKLKPGEVNLMGIQANHKDDKSLEIVLLIRNGTEKNVTFQQLPLAVTDAGGEDIADGTFKLEDFTVNANTSKPWRFIFPAARVKKDKLDLSKWKVRVIEQKS